MAEEVPQTKTSITAAQLVPVIAKVFLSFVGQNPSENSMAGMLGQWDLETGAGVSTYNYNIGNLKWTHEAQYFTNPAVTSQSNQFVAYPDLESGVRGWLGLLAHNARYADAWNKLVRSDLPGFAQAVQDAGYAGKSTTYAKALLGRAQKYLSLIPPPVQPTATFFNTWGPRILAGSLATGALYAGWHFLLQPRLAKPRRLSA